MPLPKLSDFTRYQALQARSTVVIGIMALVLLAVVGRGVQLQFYENEKFQNKSSRQVNRNLKLRARRGMILDRNGVALSASVEKPSIYVDPKYVEYPDDLIAMLRETLGDSFHEKSLAPKLRDRKKRFVSVARRVPPENAEALKREMKAFEKRKRAELKAELERSGKKGRVKFRMQGVYFTPESQRYHPLQNRAGQVLGFVGFHQSDDLYAGREGLEARFEEHLKGGEYSLDATTDVRGRRIYTGEEPDFHELEGDSLVLSLDERIQYIAESELAHQIQTMGADSGSVIVSDPKTGDILAMASVPVFNPNRVGDHEAKARKNSATLDTFEPGSTFKSFTLAAALDSGVTNLDEVINTENGLMLLAGEYKIRDTHPARFLSVRDIIKYSSNIGAIKLARKMGKERFGKYIKDFGFGQKTGVDTHESAGRVANPKKWKGSELATISYGYGQRVTHLQLNMATAALANGGILKRPRLIKEIRNRKGELVKSYPVQDVRRVVSERTTRLVTNALKSVVEPKGTGPKAATAYYQVAGKTGTAKKVHKGRYDDRRWTASFVGYAPADDPALVVTVVVNVVRDWRGQKYAGGSVAAPVFSRVIQQALPLVGVFPQGDAVEPEVAESTRRRRRRNSKPEEAIKTPPKYTNGVVSSSVETSMKPVPSYLGLSLRQALNQSRDLGQEIRVEGSGKILSQEPGPGTFVADGVTITLRGDAH